MNTIIVWAGIIAAPVISLTALFLFAATGNIKAHQATQNREDTNKKTR